MKTNHQRIPTSEAFGASARKPPVDGWAYDGIALPRGEAGAFDCDVTGDPCVVWDESIRRFRMFYFAQRHDQAGREVNANAQAISISARDVDAGMWEKRGPLVYTNAGHLSGGQTHKPWILMDPHQPSMPARIDGRFWLFTVSFRDGRKCVQRAWSPSLEGPWILTPEPVLEVGGPEDFDGYHVDTVTAYWFADRKQILLFYKGYPAEPQADQPGSPWGSSLAAAVMSPNETRARKLGKLIAPSSAPEHWQAGWVSSVQILPAHDGGWWGLMSGSPTPPAPIAEEPDMREPAPSLGGWAYTQEDWPVKGWSVEPQPIVELDDLSHEAKQSGMKTNLWRHHILTTQEGHYLFCNSGSYGEERMFVRRSPQLHEPTSDSDDG